MILALLLAAACVYVLWRASRSDRWSDRHTLAVIVGALVTPTLGGMLFIQPDIVNLLGLALIAVVTALAVAGLDRRLRKRGSSALAAGGPSRGPKG